MGGVAGGLGRVRGIHAGEQTAPRASRVGPGGSGAIAGGHGRFVRLMVQLLYVTGMRLMELLRLRVMDAQGLRLQFSQIVIRNLLRFRSEHCCLVNHSDSFKILQGIKTITITSLE